MKRTIFALLVALAPFVARAQVEPPDLTEPQKIRSGVVAEKLTNVPQTMVGPIPTKTVTYCTFVGGAAEKVVTLRPIGGGTPQVNVTVPAGATVGKNFNAKVPPAGFEALTTTPAGDVSVICNYITNTVTKPPVTTAH